MKTTNSKPKLIFYTIFFTLISTCVISFGPILKASDSFIIYIIHRDSLLSPLFDNTTTHYQKIQNALLRSEDRVNYLFHNNIGVINDDDDPHPIVLGHGRGEYIMQYSLGHPQFTTYGLIDTGSSWTWLQCKPSQSSYNQGLLAFLNTNVNRDLTPIYYDTPLCNNVVRTSVEDVHNDPETCQCMYEQRYLDTSSTIGHAYHTLLRLQTITGGFVGFPMHVFGCSRSYSGNFVHAASGIVALGKGPASLVTQISNRIDGKFGYCLVPLGGPDLYSEMRFGQSAVFGGPDVVYTPMIEREPISTYWVSLEAISVGDLRIPFISSGDTGNTIIDCGSIVARLPHRFFDAIAGQVEAELDLLHTRAASPFEELPLCYSQNSIQAMGGPVITIHLRGGDMVLSPENTYIEVADNVVCFSFARMRGFPNIVLGATTQTNFMVTFDLHSRHISFKKMNCASLHD